MRYRPPLRGRSLLGLLLAAGACADATGPALPLDVSLTASAATASADRPVTLTVTATNRGARPVEVLADPCPEAYRVTAASGAVVAPGPTLCAAMATIRVLQPGERLALAYSWAGTTRPSVTGYAVPLPAGTYQLRGFVVARGREVTSEAVPILVQP